MAQGNKNGASKKSVYLMKFCKKMNRNKKEYILEKVITMTDSLVLVQLDTRNIYGSPNQDQMMNSE